MIQLNKNYSVPEALAESVPVKVVSVGGAGLNALDRIVLDGLEKASVVAINTDVQSLTSSVAAHKVQLGRSITRGLGTGGDPELGYDAAVESVDEIREALADARMIFVSAGLGGGSSPPTPAVTGRARWWTVLPPPRRSQNTRAGGTIEYAWHGGVGSRARAGVTGRGGRDVDSVVSLLLARFGRATRPSGATE